MQNFFSYPALRQCLALYRLLLLFAIACFLAIETGFELQRFQEAGQNLATPVPTLHQPVHQTLPFLGINVALEKYTPVDRRAALATLQQSGFGWVRQRLDWGLIEAQPNRYDWQLSDAIVTDTIATGLIPVFVLDGSPAWARGPENLAPTDNPFAPPADPATFARFAAAVAGRYQDRVYFYQIWDEPNIAPHWGNRLIEPFAYAQLLKTAAPMLRAANPNAVIITAALAPTRDRGHLAIDEVYFLQRLYAAGAAPFFDVVATQPFGFGYTPDDPRARPEILNFQRVKLIRRAMLAAGDGDTPIWAVRYGWNTDPHSPWRTVRPADQVAFATDALSLARQAWPWLTAMGWAIDQPAQPRTDPAWGFALTPPLRNALHAWHKGVISARQSMDRATSHVPTRGGWALLLAGWLLLGWRTVAALHLCPWRQWRQSYAERPPWFKLTSWLVLCLVYYFATWPPLIALCGVAAVLLITCAPSMGLGFVALLLPFYFQHKELHLVNGRAIIPPAHAMLFCLWIALLTTAWPLFSWRSRAKIHVAVKRFHRTDWLAVTWIGTSLLSSAHVWHWPAYGQGLVDLVLLPCLAYTAVRRLVTTPARHTQLVAALFAGGLGAALIGLVLWGQGKGTVADGVLRLVGLYFSPNHTALYLERTLWLGLGLALSIRGALRRWLLLATGVIGIALWLTASRGAWILGLPFGALLFVWGAGWLQWHNVVTATRWTGRLVIVSVMAVVSMLFWIGGANLSLLLNPLWERVTNSATINERVITWQATLQLWQDHWLVGVGPGGFFWRYPSYLPWQAQNDPNLLHPHNLWLELAAGWGVLGLLWFVLLLWQLRRIYDTLQSQGRASSQESPHWQQIGLLAALGAGMAHGQVDAFAALPDLALWNWLALGLVVNGVWRSKADIQTKKRQRPAIV